MDNDANSLLWVVRLLIIRIQVQHLNSKLNKKILRNWIVCKGFNIENCPLLLIAMHLLKGKRWLSKIFLLVVISSAVCSFLLHTKWIRLHGFYDTAKPAVDYIHRNTIVNFVCAQNRHTNVSLPVDKKVAAQLYVEHQHKFIYCEVPKAGCSNWKRIILLLNNSLGRTVNELRHYQVHSSPLLRRLSSYSLAKQKELLSNYTKVMFTRDPLERVVSAYRDKFLHEDDVYYSKTMAGIIRERLNIKGNHTDKITFQDFVRFIVAQKAEYRDTHWKPMYQLCDPCKVHYNIIGKYETLTRDADYVLRTIRAPENLKYPSMKHHSNDSRTNEDIIGQYLKMLPTKLFRQLLKVYSIDFSMFEYKHQESID